MLGGITYQPVFRNGLFDSNFALGGEGGGRHSGVACESLLSGVRLHCQQVGSNFFVPLVTPAYGKMPGDWQMGLTGILRDASHLGCKDSSWKPRGHDVDIPRFLISRTGRRVAYGKNKFLLRYSGPGTLPGHTPTKLTNTSCA